MFPQNFHYEAFIGPSRVFQSRLRRKNPLRSLIRVTSLPIYTLLMSEHTELNPIPVHLWKKREDCRRAIPLPSQVLSSAAVHTANAALQQGYFIQQTSSSTSLPPMVKSRESSGPVCWTGSTGYRGEALTGCFCLQLCGMGAIFLHGVNPK